MPHLRYAFRIVPLIQALLVLACLAFASFADLQDPSLAPVAATTVLEEAAEEAGSQDWGHPNGDPDDPAALALSPASLRVMARTGAGEAASDAGKACGLPRTRPATGPPCA